MDFGGYQEAVTRVCRAKRIRRGSRAAEACGETCRLGGEPQTSRLRRFRVSTTHLRGIRLRPDAMHPGRCLQMVALPLLGQTLGVFYGR